MSDSSWVDMQTPFDIISVMQYGGYGFSNNGQPTITGLASDFFQIIWLRSELIKYLKWGKKLICNFPFPYFFHSLFKDLKHWKVVVNGRDTGVATAGQRISVTSMDLWQLCRLYGCEKCAGQSIGSYNDGDHKVLEK